MRATFDRLTDGRGVDEDEDEDDPLTLSQLKVIADASASLTAFWKRLRYDESAAHLWWTALSMT